MSVCVCAEKEPQRERERILSQKACVNKLESRRRVRVSLRNVERETERKG